ncbi:hypothetical protein K353_01998 [Kitasatospora sp. SolWspMP-SS2h]|uniref:hypothetical protein n=1 Tax=Kitasatospora sp. SolWspMP-SS2h TaxID=1305729 RepID=UPI000DB9E606|nr:hypothetical protein [Kitasatospora sp. SolWspMP-SS2h]RAJ43738.1 hypothetical protein K353_01998 [Kitasatospora sp. SolWspMP-SS2h]
MTAPKPPEGMPPHPTAPPPAPAGPAPPRRIDLQGWSAVITALVGVATLGAGFAGGYLSQSQSVPGLRPQPTVTVTLPGPAVPAPAPAPVGTPPATVSPPVDTLPGEALGSPGASGTQVLLASPDAGRGGTRTVLTGQGFPPGAVVRVSFVVKDESELDQRLRDLRDTESDARGAFSVEVVIPADLGGYADMNAYLRARAGTGGKPVETVFDLLP